MKTTLIVLLYFTIFGCSKWQLEDKKMLPLPEMIEVKGGSFEMGSFDGYIEDRPTHFVKLNDFRICKYEVTVKQYKDFCLATNKPFPSNTLWAWKDDHPMVNVSWKDTNSYCEWLSKLLGRKYRLPTEAEWEYAARGGNKSNNYLYAGSNTAEEVGWFGGNTNLISQETRPIGQKKPNELGIYDMSGNVWEWCSDWYETYTTDIQTNPKGPTTGKMKIMRGGSWFDFVVFLRTTRRYPFDPENVYYGTGFRIVEEI